jgi:hypothetical protein
MGEVRDDQPAGPLAARFLQYGRDLGTAVACQALEYAMQTAAVTNEADPADRSSA